MRLTTNVHLITMYVYLRNNHTLWYGWRVELIGSQSGGQNLHQN